MSNSKLKNTFGVIFTFIAAALAMAGQYIVFETSDWGIDYLNHHAGFFKIVPLLVGVVFSIIFCWLVSNWNKFKSQGSSPAGPIKYNAQVFFKFLTIALIWNLLLNYFLE
jgi:hypothetical protein